MLDGLGELNQIPGFRCVEPGGAFYVFPNVAVLCNRLGITSHGLAMYLLEPDLVGPVFLATRS